MIEALKLLKEKNDQAMDEFIRRLKENPIVTLKRLETY